MSQFRVIRLFFSILFIIIIMLPNMATALDFGVHGYYRNRYEFNHDLDLQSSGSLANNDRFGFIQFSQMRFRLEPDIKINDNLSIHSQLDFLDNLVYGSHDTKQLEILSPVVGTQTLPAGPGSLGTVGGAAGENGSVNIRRAWLDILLPIGKFRLGRQPSHWGLGIFQNDGSGTQGDFGDSADRVLFITQYPLEQERSVVFGAAWDIAF